MSSALQDLAIWARALNKNGVGRIYDLWRLGRRISEYRAQSETKLVILLLVTNGKTYARFLLAPNSTTLNELERPLQTQYETIFLGA